MSVQTYCVTSSKFLTLSEPQYSCDSNKNKVNRKEGSGNVLGPIGLPFPYYLRMRPGPGTTISLALYAWSPPGPPPLSSHSRGLLGKAYLAPPSLKGAHRLCLPLAFPLASLSHMADALLGCSLACHGGLSSTHIVKFLWCFPPIL